MRTAILISALIIANIVHGSPVLFYESREATFILIGTILCIVMDIVEFIKKLKK